MVAPILFAVDWGGATIRDRHDTTTFEADTAMTTVVGRLAEKEPFIGLKHVEAWSIIKASIVPPGQQVSTTRTYPYQGHEALR
jgi:hypothetical protein